MDEVQGTILSEFYGDGDYENRRATVAGTGGTFMVLMYESHDGDWTLVEGRNVDGHTQQYAEDCAENWVSGVIR